MVYRLTAVKLIKLTLNIIKSNKYCSCCAWVQSEQHGVTFSRSLASSTVNEFIWFDFIWPNLSTPLSSILRAKHIANRMSWLYGVWFCLWGEVYYLFYKQHWYPTVWLCFSTASLINFLSKSIKLNWRRAAVWQRGTIHRQIKHPWNMKHWKIFYFIYLFIYNMQTFHFINHSQINK